MQGYLAAVSAETRTLLVLSIILFAGFIMTRLTNTLNLPQGQRLYSGGYTDRALRPEYDSGGYDREHELCE